MLQVTAQQQTAHRQTLVPRGAESLTDDLEAETEARSFLYCCPASTAFLDVVLKNAGLQSPSSGRSYSWDLTSAAAAVKMCKPFYRFRWYTNTQTHTYVGGLAV